MSQVIQRQTANKIRTLAREQRRSIRTLYMITGNLNKLKEARAILQNSVPKLEHKKIDLPELQGESTVAISQDKCRQASEGAGVGVPVLVEDTSLCFHALNNLPGPYIKWFLQGMGIAKLPLLLAGFEDKTAHAECVFSLSDGVLDVKTFVGTCQGTIVNPSGPKESFGWDPIFLPDAGKGKTFAEMSKAEKNVISHRSHALEQFQDWLDENPEFLLGDTVASDVEDHPDWQLDESSL